MCGKGQTGVSNQSSQLTIPPEILARYNDVWNRGVAAADKPFQTYGGEFVAPVTGTQRAGIDTISNAGATYGPYANAAMGTATGNFGLAGTTYGGAQGAAQPFNSMAGGLIPASVGASNYLTGADIGQYMSPYNEAVVQQTLRLLDQQQGQQQNELKSNLIQQGAYGGDRSGVARAVLSGQQDIARGNVVSGLYNQNYQQALAAAQQQQAQRVGALQQGAGLASNLGQQLYGQQMGVGQAYQGLGQAAAGTYSNLGTTALGNELQYGQALMGAGTLEQQTQQANLTALYNQWLQQQAYPFQTTQFLANIAEGTGALSGSTTNQYAYQPQPFFSDDDLKENVRTLGHTRHGLRIVRYNLKDDPKKLLRIGFLASDVEKKMPEAVTRHAGVRAVDYERATRASGGGIVSNDNAWEGFANGGGTWDGPLPIWLEDRRREADKTGKSQAVADPAGGALQGLSEGRSAGDILWRSRGAGDPLMTTVGGIMEGKDAGDIALEAGKTLLGPAAGLFGFAKGGSADSDVMAALLAAHQAMYPGAAGRPGMATGPRGMELRPPAARTLLKPDTQPLQQQESGLRSAMRDVSDIGKTASGIGELYTLGKDALVGSPANAKTGAPATGGLVGTGGKWDYDQGWLGRNTATGTGSGAAPNAMGTGAITSTPLPDLTSTTPATTSVQPLVAGLAAPAPADLADLSDLGDTVSSVFARRGGRMRRAAGGGLAGGMPYVTSEAGGYVPDELYTPMDVSKLASTQRSMQPPAGGGARGGSGGGGGFGDALSGIASVAKLGLMFLKDGGRAGYADGGVPDDPYGSLEKALRSDLPAYENVIPFPLVQGVVPRSRSDELPPYQGVVPALTESPALRRSMVEHALRPAPATPPDDPAAEVLAAARAEPNPAPGAGVAPSPPTAPVAAAAPSLPAPTAVSPPPGGNAPTTDNYWPQMLRQESGNQHFNPKTGEVLTSSAGARGIAQVMPGTAPEAAKLAGLPWNPELFNRPRTGDPVKDKEAADYNEALGRAYYNEQLRTFKDPAIAAAAYNAGPGAVQAALAKSQATGQSYLSFLPSETQKYVAAVSGKSAPVMAANVPASTPTNAGLAPSAPAAAAPDRDFLTRAGDWWDRNEKYVIPALSFLGNMLASPSRTLAGSIGSGIAAAAPQLVAQQRVGQEQQRIEIARNAQNMNMWGQLRQIYNAQIANNGQADPQIVAQMGRLAALIGIGAPDGKTPVPEATAGAGILPTGGPSAGVAPSATPTGAGVVPPPAATPQALPAPTGTSQVPAVPQATPVAPGQPADVPPSEKLPTVDFPPSFLQQLAPTANPAELRRRAGEMTDPGQAAALRQRADQVQADIIRNGGGQGNAGFVPLPSAGAYRQAQERIPDNVAWATAQQPIFQQRQVMRNSIEHIAKAVEAFEPGALADYKAEAQALANALGVAPPNTATMNATEFQTFIKNARNVVLGSATGDQKTDAARQILAEGFADPHLQPKAVQRILAQALGNLDAADDYYRDVTGTLQRVPHLDRSLRANEFNEKNPLERYYQKHEKDIAVRGATPEKASELTPGQAYIVEPSHAKAWGLPDITKPTKLRFKGVEPDGRIRFGRING